MVKYELEKETQIVSTQTKPYRQVSCRGDLQACYEGGDKEQTVLKVDVKLVVATLLLLLLLLLLLFYHYYYHHHIN